MMLASGLEGRCRVPSSRGSRTSSSQAFLPRVSSGQTGLAGRRVVQPLLQQQQQRQAVCAAAEAPNSSSADSQAEWVQQPASPADPAPAQQGQQQRQSRQQRQRQPQQQQPRNSTSKYNPYDNTRWWVRSSDWKKGAPAMEQRPVDFILLGPNALPHRHASYVTAKLWTGNKGRAMMLFHGKKGAAKVLSVLHLVTQQLQRKHSSTLLCQVGPSDMDPLKLKLLARLWPYAGTWQPSASASSSTSSGSGDTYPAAAAAAAAGAAPAASTAASSSSSSSNSSSSSGTGASVPKGRCSWLRRGLQGSLPDPQKLPPSIRKLPPFALPAVISRKCTFRSCRTTDPKALAQQIATAITQKGRCRVVTAGGLAALHALQGVRFADVMLARAWQQGLVMHVECVTEKQPLTVMGERPAPVAAEPLDAAASADGWEGDPAVVAAGAAAEAVAFPTAAAAAAAAASAEGETAASGDGVQGVYIRQEWVEDWGDNAGATPISSRNILLDPVKKRQQVKYYVLTLIAAHRDQDMTPSTSVFPSMLRQQQQQQQGKGGS